MTAHLCIKCHEYFDQYKWLENMACVEASEEFLHCIALTWVRLVNDGVIKI